MAIGGFFPSRNLPKSARLKKRDSVRRVLLEALEPRQLLTVGPQLIGIQPNSGSLIEGGEILNISPRELVIRFDDAVGLDAATLSGIDTGLALVRKYLAWLELSQTNTPRWSS